MSTRLCPECPAASALDGPPVGGPSIWCGIMAREKWAADELTEGTYVSPLLDQRDASIIYGFCTGTALPVYDEVPDGGRAHHTACPLWRAERERLWARRERLADPVRRGPTPAEVMEAEAEGVSDLGEVREVIAAAAASL